MQEPFLRPLIIYLYSQFITPACSLLSVYICMAFNFYLLNRIKTPSTHARANNFNVFAVIKRTPRVLRYICRSQTGTTSAAAPSLSRESINNIIYDMYPLICLISRAHQIIFDSSHYIVLD